MALIKCPECKSEVSDKANNCPKCGFPLDFSETLEQNAVEKSGINIRLLIGFIIVAVVVVFAMFFYRNVVMTSRDSVQYSITAVNMLKEHMKHPDSLEIRKIKYLKDETTGASVKYEVYIEFAAENEVGGRVPDKAFFIDMPELGYSIYPTLYIESTSTGGSGMYAACAVDLKHSGWEDVDVDLVMKNLDK